MANILSDYTAQATVTVQIVFTSKGHWGHTATIAEVARLGGAETIQAINNLLGQGRHSGLECQVVGEPKIDVICKNPKRER